MTFMTMYFFWKMYFSFFLMRNDSYLSRFHICLPGEYKNWDLNRWRQLKVFNGAVWNVLKTEWPSSTFCFHVLLPPKRSCCGFGLAEKIQEESSNGKNRWAIHLWDSPWHYLKRQLDCLNNEAFVTLPAFLPSALSLFFFFFFQTHFDSMWNNSRRQSKEGVSVWHHGRLDLVEKKGKQVLTDGWE